MKRLEEDKKKRIRYMYTWMFRRYRTNTLADSGSISDKPVLGAELIPDASRWFDSSAGWSLGTGWTIGGGVLNGNVTSYLSASTPIAIVSGKKYLITYTISSYTSGALRVGTGSVEGSQKSAAGTYSEIIQHAGAPNVVSINAAGGGTFVGTIDNISVREVLINSVTTDYLKMAQNNRMDKSIRFGWIGEAGSKIESGKVSKLYDINCFEQLGSELVTNGDFSNGTTGWAPSTNISVVNGELVYASPGQYTGVSQTITGLKIGSKYKLTSSLRRGTASAAIIDIFGVSGTTLNNFTTTPETKSVVFTATATSHVINLFTGDATAGTTMIYDNISLKEVLNATNTNNATQTTPTSRPYLTGNIAPNEKLGLKNPNGGSNYMTHPTISFAANESWSVTLILNRFGNNTTDNVMIDGSYTNGIFFSSATRQLGINNSLNPVNSWFNYIFREGKNYIINIVCNGNSNFKLYVNGVFDSEFTKISSFIFTGLLLRGTPGAGGYFQGQIKSHIIRSIALTQQQVTAEYNYLRSVYPEIESVVIGTQTWATSNCEMAATPQGNVIAEMQAAGNVEKMTNIADREFSSDTGFWTKGTNGGTVTIENGICTSTGIIAGFDVISRTITVTAAKWYKVTFTVLNYVSGGLAVNISDSPGLIVYANGTYTHYVKDNNGQGYFRLRAQTSPFVGSIDNVSVQEIGWSGSQELYDGIYAQTAEAASSVEKITNIADREFSSDTGFWTKGGGATISNGVGNLGSGSALYGSSISFGKYAKVTFTVVITSGTLSVYCGGNAVLRNTISLSGTYTVLVDAGTTDSRVFFLSNAGSSMTIDNVSVKELGLSDATSIANYTYAAVKAAGFWCHYNNSVDNGAIYGKLYNWFAVKLLQMDIDYYNTANPTTLWGWRVPTQADFQTLSNYLGGDAVSGGKLKLAGTTYWNSPNTGADNSSGFSALAGGIRNTDGSVFGINQYGGTSMSTETNSTTRPVIELAYNGANLPIPLNRDKARGNSLRLILT